MQIEQPKRETLPFREDETILVTSYTPVNYNVPLHYHAQFELHFISGGKGLKTIAGTSSYITADFELMLLGPNLKHAWEQYQNTDESTKIVVIHFDEALFKKQTISPAIESLLKYASGGVLFSVITSKLAADRLFSITRAKKKAIAAELISLLDVLADDPEKQILNTHSSEQKTDLLMVRLENFLKKNYHEKIKLEDVCKLTGKSPTSINRFIKGMTGTTFVNYLNDIRTGFAARSLAESSLSIAEIARASGFNNLANFNRAFKKNHGITPLRYREIFYGRKKFV